MRAPRRPESESRSLRSLGSAYFDDSGRHAADYREIRNVLNDYGIGADDHIVADPDAPENLGAGTEVDPIADCGRAERIGAAAVANCYTVTDQAVIANYGVAVDDDTAVVLYTKPAADGRRGAD